MKQDLISTVWERAGSPCEYCQFPSEFAWLPFQIDHIIAEKHGGATVAENLALSCFYCNSFKGPNIAGIDPDGRQDVAVQLFHPRNSHWSDHFEWNGSFLTGKTATGRVTISMLRINDDASVETRRILAQTGYVY